MKKADGTELTPDEVANMTARLSVLVIIGPQGFARDIQVMMLALKNKPAWAIATLARDLSAGLLQLASCLDLGYVEGIAEYQKAKT